MTAQQLITELSTAITAYETTIADLNSQIVALKAQLPPSGTFNVTITGINQAQVTWS